MKSSRNVGHGRLRVAIALVLAAIVFAAVSASDSLPSWEQFVEAGSKIEGALFRQMPMPGGPVVSRRPPGEAKPLLDDLVRGDANNEQLYSLRALEEEQELDFSGAETDWKAFAARSADKAAGQIALADFYQRRGRPTDEIAALSLIAAAPGREGGEFEAAKEQQSWRAFERIFRVIGANGFAAEVSIAQYDAWAVRYPAESEVYTRYFDYLLAQKKFAEAVELLSRYSREFPADTVFAVRGRAQLEFRRGNHGQSLAVYDRAFQPLWPRELIESYFGMLRETEGLRAFLAGARAEIARDPNDLNAAARIFFYYQQENKTDAALAAVNEFRAHKESTHTAWSGEELYTFARILDDAHLYTESARYYFALYNAPMQAAGKFAGADIAAGDPRELALAGLADILLTAPEEPLRIGAGDLSFYKDVATVDSGPGFLNGILSLLFNSESPRDNFAQEEQRAIPYFHRARAAELISQLEHDFPNARELPSLRARLIVVYAGYGETDAVIRESKRFLEQFPGAAGRMEVSLGLADAYARRHQAEAELGVYDALLAELAAQSHHLPLAKERKPAAKNQVLQNANDEATASAESEYARVLDRYLARLISLHRLPAALEALRREVDRNPNDAGIYERLAQFLEQNQMDAQVEEVYRRAIEKFPDRSWYQKLARFYLRRRRSADLDALTQEVVKDFAGSELETYFREVGTAGNSRLYLQLNLYASRRFPHDLMFVRNLLNAYQSSQTRNPAAWEALLRQHWFEAEDLRNQFFDFLSRTGRMEEELAALSTIEPAIGAKRWDSAERSNPAAVAFYAEAELWQSHYEKAAPALGAESMVFAGDAGLNVQASAVYRSMAFFDPRNTQIAVSISKRAATIDPTNRDSLARIGDIYADRNLLADAAPYWNRMTEIEPGTPQSFVEAATVFWDYYEFSDALRILNQGRKKLEDESLFGYEEGAIYETERDYPRAIAEYVKASLSGANSTATGRLLTLARRPELRAAVDAAARTIASGKNPAAAEMRLRISILEAEGRRSDVGAFLLDALQRANTSEAAHEIEAIAQERGMKTVEERVLEREAAMTADPVTSLQTRYRLAQSYEGRKDLAGAQRIVEEIYAQNPKVMGVVRATVDFYWRNKMRPRAIEVLLQAAHDSYPELQIKFTFEAARKNTEAGDLAKAHELLKGLLEKSPFDSEMIAAEADAYSREGDSSGLRDFYLARIGLMKAAPFSSDQRVERIAALRRGLIPALTRLKDYAGGADQYIELLKSYPEDASLSMEAARYAADHAAGARLVGFYAKAVEESPRDVRWPIVLARVDTAMENYAAALEAYSKALSIRPDRADLHAARADLLERLGRDTDAAAEYAQLYAVSYHDPQWMLKLAEVRARHGEMQATIDALKTALIEGRPDSASNYFAVARKLEDWNMVEDARNFAEQGVARAGDNLLADGARHSDAQTYIRIMTRLRRQADGFAVLAKAREAATGSTAASMLRQVETQGVGSVTDKQWREREQATRRAAASAGMKLAAKSAGEIAAGYFTPEEKTSFEQFLIQQEAGAAYEDQEQIWLSAAESAGFAALEANWRYQLILRAPKKGSDYQALVILQNRRMQFGELGRQLEEISARSRRTDMTGPLYAAAAAYRTNGDWQSELRVLTAIEKLESLGGEQEQRYFELLLAHDPEELVEVAQSGATARRDDAANFAVTHAQWDLVQRVIAARSSHEASVWQRANLALAGLYSGGERPQVSESFLGVLSPKSIGEMVGVSVPGGKPGDREAALAGTLWFYYGSRYGEYLGTTHRPNFEDFVPAGLEAAPGNADSYAVAAEDYNEFGEYSKAIADYEHALELDPRRTRFQIGLARICWKQNDKDRAIAEWKSALVSMTNEMGHGALPESFWTDFATLAEDLRQRSLAEQFQPELEKFLRVYIAGNSTYRDSALLIAVYRALNYRPGVISWFVQLASSGKSPEGYLADLAASAWIPAADRAPIYEKLVSVVQAHADQLQGDERAAALQGVRDYEARWLASLIDARQFSRASGLLASFGADEVKPAGENEISGTRPQTYTSERIEIAAGLGHLPELLDGFRARPETIPPSQELLQTAQILERMKLRVASRQLLEFAYTRALEKHELTAPNFLGLAEIRLRAGKVQEGAALLQRLTLVVGEPNENLDSAAALLEKAGHAGEATGFLERLVAAQPWNSGVRIRLENDRIAAKLRDVEARDELCRVARDSSVPYNLRADAATALAARNSSSNNSAQSLGSRELELLASSSPASMTETNQEFFVISRERAAAAAGDAKHKIEFFGSVLREVTGDDSPRIPLFFALAETQKDSLAIADVEPLIQAGVLPELRSDSEVDPYEVKQALLNNPEADTASDSGRAAMISPTDQTASDDDAGEKACTGTEENDSFASETRCTPPRISLITPREQEHLAEELSIVYRRMDEPPLATQYLQIALQLETDAERRATLHGSLTRLLTESARRDEDAARRPLIHNSLEQDRVVRPRLIPLRGSESGQSQPEERNRP